MINLFSKYGRVGCLNSIRCHSKQISQQKSLNIQYVGSLNYMSSYHFSLEKKKQQEKISRMMQESIKKKQQDVQKNYKKQGLLYPEAAQEYSQLNEQVAQETPEELWKSLILLQLPQVYYLFQSCTSEYFSFNFSNSLSLIIDSVSFNMAIFGGMYFAYAMLKKESYNILLTPFTLGCLAVSMHLAYDLNVYCFLPIYTCQLIQILADYQGSESKRYPSYMLSTKARYFMINFFITLAGFFLMQGFQNHQTKMKKLKKQYEDQSKELSQQQQQQQKQQNDQKSIQKQ
ncbi:hypothetical protein ABPG74_013600 [Tetrahymena malaccensis]